MNNQDYVLLRDTKPLSNEEYLERINLYNEISIEEKIAIHTKCIINIMHNLSRIGMTVDEMTHMMKHWLKSHDKMIEKEKENK